MPTYITLAKFTGQGAKSVRDTTKRAKMFMELAKKRKVSYKGIYWTMGRFDVISVFEAPDDETATALVLDLGSKGNVSTQTMRAFSAQEMDKILSKIG